MVDRTWSSVHVGYDGVLIGELFATSGRLMATARSCRRALMPYVRLCWHGPRICNVHPFSHEMDFLCDPPSHASMCVDYTLVSEHNA